MKHILLFFLLFFACGVYTFGQRHEIGIIGGGVNYIGEVGNTQYIRPKNRLRSYLQTQSNSTYRLTRSISKRKIW